MGAGLVRLRLLRLYAGTQSAGPDQRALQEHPRWLVEESPDHAPNGDPWRLSARSTFGYNWVPMRAIAYSRGQIAQRKVVLCLVGLTSHDSLCSNSHALCNEKRTHTDAPYGLDRTPHRSRDISWLCRRSPRSHADSPHGQAGLLPESGSHATSHRHRPHRNEAHRRQHD